MELDRIIVKSTFNPKDILALHREYLSTPTGKLYPVKTIAGILITSIAYSLTWAGLIYILSHSWNGSDFNLIKVLFLTSDYFPVGAFCALISILLIGSVLLANFTIRFSSGSLSRYLQAPRMIILSPDHLYERTQSIESWITLDQIEKIVNKKQYYFIYRKDNEYVYTFPKRELTTIEENLFEKYIQMISAPQMNGSQESILDSKVLIPEPVGQYLQLGNFKSQRDKLTYLFDKLRHWAMIDSQIRSIAIYSILILFFSLVGDLSRTPGEFVPKMINSGATIITSFIVLFFIIGYRFIHSIVIENKKESDRENPFFFVDEMGIAFGDKKHVTSISWSFITMIVQTKHYYHFVEGLINGSIVIPNRILSVSDQGKLRDIIKLIRCKNPGLRIKKDPF